nr:AlNc14C78G5155 [Albugo laibachii Nc14]|eukprot:CCA19738.1 AlNc14C78G5155 [Albugo laibachii Nc14]
MDWDYKWKYESVTVANGNAIVNISSLWWEDYFRSGAAYYGRLEDSEANSKVREGDQDVKVADRRRRTIVWLYQDRSRERRRFRG